MPIYVYKFVETGETIEVQQAFTDDALTEAVHPGNGRTMSVKKVFQPVGVTFKGGGFYKTDSRGSSSGTKPAASSTTASTDASSTATAPATPATPAPTPAPSTSATPAT
jgi:predicted nucleic acid-binding Zn ribbon protein